MRVNRWWQTSLYLFSLFDSILLNADAITVSWHECVFCAVILNLHPHRSRSTTRPGSARLHRNHPGAGLEEAQGQDLHLQASVRLCRRPTGRSRAACYRNHLHPDRLEPWHALHRHPRGRTRAEEKCSCHLHRLHRWAIPNVKLILFAFVQQDNVNVLFSGVDNKDCVVKLTFICIFFPNIYLKSSDLDLKHTLCKNVNTNTSTCIWFVWRYAPKSVRMQFILHCNACICSTWMNCILQKNFLFVFSTWWANCMKSACLYSTSYV